MEPPETETGNLSDRPYQATARRWLPAALFIAAIGFLGFVPSQSDFWWIALGYIPAFAVYAWVLRRSNDVSLTFLLGLAVAARVLLLFAFPNLSDDVYRFIWDGRLLVQGYNPFDHLPAYYREEGHSVPGLSAALFQELNSPEYFTIYPPVAQATFALACWLFPTSVAGSALVMKLFLLACEVGTIWLLPKLLRTFDLPENRSLIYALNPLVIVEIMGNLHYEGAMIFFLLLGIWWIQKARLYPAAIAMALSVAAKLLPLLFFPFFIRRLGWRDSIRFFAAVGAVLLLLFFPLVSGVFLENFGNSLDLYFRKFEFNGSFYYLSRWIGYLRKGYNRIAQIGPMLAGVTFLGIVGMALWRKSKTWRSLPGLALFAITLYLFGTTTVHPWYVAMPLVLCLFTDWRFPVVWSGMILLTYVNYSYVEYYENLWIVGLEYGVVFGYLAWECRGLLVRNNYPDSFG